MKKVNKTILISTFIVCLLPMLIGLYFYHQLPSLMPSHFNFQGEVDSYLSKDIILFGMPLILAVVNSFVQIITQYDPKRNNYSERLITIVYWIIPLISVFIESFIIAYSLGYDLNMMFWMVNFMGVLFIVIGNYLPKCKQNYMLGIKLPWTLNDEDNWNKTHHLGGYLFVVVGIVAMITNIVFPTYAIWIVLGGAIIGTMITSVYSFMIYKKGRN